MSFRNGTVLATLTRSIRDVFTELDQTQGKPALSNGQLWLMFLLASACLLGLNYLKFFSALNDCIGLVASLFGESPRQWIAEFKRLPYANLLQNVWWGMWHWLFFFILPWLLIRWGFKSNLKEYGWGFGETHKHWLGYLALLTPIMVFAVLASSRPDFVNHYPFYTDAKLSIVDLLLWECIYISQFITVEFFFRGFLLSSLQPRFGSVAIAIMSIPYVMLHFPKPWLEATGAIGFGIFLGILALRSRSIWGGVIVHAGIALCMDCAALIQSGNFPITLFRN